MCWQFTSWVTRWVCPTTRRTRPPSCTPCTTHPPGGVPPRPRAGRSNSVRATSMPSKISTVRHLHLDSPLLLAARGQCRPRLELKKTEIDYQKLRRRPQNLIYHRKSSIFTFLHITSTHIQTVCANFQKFFNVSW